MVVAAYALVFIVFALAPPLLVQRRGWPAAAALLVAVLVASAFTMTYLGGVHRERMQTGQLDWGNVMLPLVSLAVLVTPGLVAFEVMRRRSADPTRVVGLAAAIHIAIGLLAYIPFLLSVNCALSGECV